MQQHDRQGEVAVLLLEDLLLLDEVFGALLYFLFFLVIAGDFTFLFLDLAAEELLGLGIFAFQQPDGGQNVPV